MVSVNKALMGNLIQNLKWLYHFEFVMITPILNDSPVQQLKL